MSSCLSSPQRKYIGLGHLLWSSELWEDWAEEGLWNCGAPRWDSHTFSGSLWGGEREKKIVSKPCCTFCIARSGALRFHLWTGKHIFIIWCSSKGGRVFGLMCIWGSTDGFDSSAQITVRDIGWEVTARGMVSCAIVQLLYLSISINLSCSRWHWRSDGAVYRSQCSNNTRNIWLPVWGKVIFFPLFFSLNFLH